MKKVLVTGFEPFGGNPVNPSWEAAKLLPGTVPGAEVAVLRLPVAFGHAGQLLLEKVKEMQPDYVLLTGLAQGRKGVTPELLGVNYRLAPIADNDGQVFDGCKINPAAPDAVMTALPAQALVKALKEQGFPASLSLSAGAYVCNDLYFAALTHEKEMHFQSLFVHVPGEEVLSIQQDTKALAIIITQIIQ